MLGSLVAGSSSWPMAAYFPSELPSVGVSGVSVPEVSSARSRQRPLAPNSTPACPAWLNIEGPQTTQRPTMSPRVSSLLRGPIDHVAVGAAAHAADTEDLGSIGCTSGGSWSSQPEHTGARKGDA